MGDNFAFFRFTKNFFCDRIQPCGGITVPFAKAVSVHALAILPQKTAEGGAGMMRYYTSEPDFFEGERLTKAEERAKSNSKRLDRLERLADEVSKQNENIARLVVQLEFTNEQLRAQDERLKEIEGRPQSRLNMIVGAVVTALCSALAGAAVTLLF